MAQDEKKVNLNEEALSDDELAEVSGGRQVTVTGSQKLSGNVKLSGSQKLQGSNKLQNGKKLQGSSKTQGSAKLSDEKDDISFRF